MRREIMQRRSMILHGTFGSYLCDALHEGDAIVIACLHAQWAYAFLLRLYLPCCWLILLLDSVTA
jgi:hypothetical protein